jgi:hypothetical protein
LHTVEAELARRGHEAIEYTAALERMMQGYEVDERSLVGDGAVDNDGVCERCGAPLPPYSGRGRRQRSFCSRRCGQRAWDERERARVAT